MINLPPYHPELNPIELVFNDLVQHLRSMAARSGAISADQFKATVEGLLSSRLFSRSDIKKKYRKRGYVY
jgi:transposase